MQFWNVRANRNYFRAADALTVDPVRVICLRELSASQCHFLPRTLLRGGFVLIYHRRSAELALECRSEPRLTVDQTV